MSGSREHQRSPSSAGFARWIDAFLHEGAHRIDLPVARVAIKLLRSAGHPAWRSRFLRERQLLASFDHPSIARLMDAGHVDGRPYLVMEYVDGVPIDDYARGRALREQLELFVRVCEPVAHAHRHLIVHRDLKPSNILVDVGGHPKLLDFLIDRAHFRASGSAGLDRQNDVIQAHLPADYFIHIGKPMSPDDGPETRPNSVSSQCQATRSI